MRVRAALGFQGTERDVGACGGHMAHSAYHVCLARDSIAGTRVHLLGKNR